ncbi:putative DNA-binding WGR domain protein [Rhizobium pisi]|nr:WGR domain-containing protein [Rhizobium pisi]MBB3135993.1 putative DNA-binding WGR domain protein [Rhizobium pisi]
MGGDRLRAPRAAANSTVRPRRLARIILPIRQPIIVMNQSRSIDSNLSLDAEPALDDHATMIAQPYELYVERVDATKNMARYYAMSIEPTLFGEACLIRRWGRIGAGGQRMMHHFTREEDAVELFLELLRKKRSRGYRPRPHFQQGPLPARHRAFSDNPPPRLHPIIDGEAKLQA